MPEPFEHPSRFATQAPDRPAVILADTGATLTYGELEDASLRVANLLRSVGAARGARVAVLVENRLEFFEICWGALRAGCYVVPINWHLKSEETAYIIDNSGATTLFASAALAADLPRDATPMVRHRFVLDGPADGYLDYGDAITGQDATSPEDECEGTWMFYSSGTTGKPKGIKPAVIGQPLGTPTSFSAFSSSLYGLGEDTVYLSPAPLYHAAPANWTTTVHRLGGTVVVMDRFEPSDVLRAIEQYQITAVQFVPTHLIRLLKLSEPERQRFDLSSLRTVVHAAAPCPPDVKRQTIEWLGPIVHEFYSGSEGVGFCALDSHEWLAHPGSVGRSLMGTVHIVSEDGGELGPGEDGEVWFETQKQFAYHRDEDKTAAAYDQRGWATLGDIGHVDADGYLYLTDRISNMVISGGVNIYPREIEDVLIGHPAVDDVAVIGVNDPDLGEAVRAVVQPSNGTDPSDDLAAELIAFCRDRLASFKCPRTVLFVPELPRLPTGKLAKRLLSPDVFAIT